MNRTQILVLGLVLAGVCVAPADAERPAAQRPPGSAGSAISAPVVGTAPRFGTVDRPTIPSPIPPERMQRVLAGEAQLTPEENFRRIVHIAYGRLAQYAANAGHELRFELDDFWTLDREDFDRVLALDLYSLPDGPVIDVTPVRHTSEIEGRVNALYKARWHDRPADGRSIQLTQELTGLTIADVLARLTADDGRYLAASAVTSVAVRVTLDGRSRTYRSLFVWLNEERDETWDRFDVLVIDTVTQRVADTLRERIPVEGLPLRRPAGPDLRSRSAASSTAVCIAGSEQRTIVKNPPIDGTNHVSGGHKGRVDLVFDCSCDTACNSTCQASTANEACFETGFTWDACHVPKSASDTSDAVVPNSAGQGVGASCAAGFQCSYRVCLFCWCNFTVGVKVVGVSISFTPQDGNWTRNLAAKVTCAACDYFSSCTTCGGGEDREILNKDPGTGDGGGGGGWGGSSCQWWCAAVWDPQILEYREECTLLC